jgi:integrase/recombinase XerD
MGVDMAKKKTSKRKTAAPKRPVKSKKPPKKKEAQDVTALITVGADVGKLIKSTDRDELPPWFNAYLAVEVEPDSHTHKAKLQDIGRFLNFFFEVHQSYSCDQWTRGLSKRFITWLKKQKANDSSGNPTERNLAPSTIERTIHTIKTAARWIHRQRPFLAGYPFGKTDSYTAGRPTWKGLKPIEVTRLISAAEQLVHIQTRANQRPRRNYAILRVLLHTALRVDEFCSLDRNQYKGKHLVNIQRKGDDVTPKIFLDTPIREVLDDYLKDERSDAAGPLFQSKTGNRLRTEDIDDVLKRIASHANATLSADDQIQLSPHTLRHTRLRQVAREKGIEFAMELSGHKSTKYIWRYIQADDEEMEAALADPWG